MSDIGSALNCLPIAYSAINSVGRMVNYAGVSISSSASLSSSGVAILDAEAQLVSSTDMDCEHVTSVFGVSDIVAVSAFSGAAAKTASCGCSLSVSSGMDLGLFVAAMYGASSAISGILSTASLVPTPSVIRSAKCKFRSKYIQPGTRSSGNAIDTFAVGYSALGGVGGYCYRSFASILSATAKAVFDAKINIPGDSGIEATANAVFDPGATIFNLEAELVSIANVIFSMVCTAGANISLAPHAGVLRDSEAEMAQTLSCSIMGSVVADGISVCGGELSISSIGNFIADAMSMPISESSFTPAPMRLADGALSIQQSSLIDAYSTRIRNALLDISSITQITAKPWFPIPLCISIVYRDVVESVVYRVANESIVYQIENESIVYWYDEDEV